MNHRQLYLETMSEFAPVAQRIKEAILAPSPGRKVAYSLQDLKVLLTGDGTTSNLVRGGVAAVAAGGLTGAMATKRPWESEEEFRRRRFRTAMGYAVGAGSIAGFALPAFQKYRQFVGDVESILEGRALEAKKEEALGRARELSDMANPKGDAIAPAKELSENAVALTAAATGDGTSPLWSSGGAVVGGVAGYRGAKAIQNSVSGRELGNIHGKGLISAGDEIARKDFLDGVKNQDHVAYLKNRSAGGNRMEQLARDIARNRQLYAGSHQTAGPVSKSPVTKIFYENLQKLERERADLNRLAQKYHGSTAKSIGFRTGGALTGAVAGYGAGELFRNYLSSKSRAGIDSINARNLAEAGVIP